MEKIIHQIWIGPYEMPDREKAFVNKLKEKNNQYEHILWTNDNLPEFPDNFKPLWDKFEAAEDYAHQADILRVLILALHGGIYLDVDFDCIEGINNTDLHESNGFFCYHGGNDYTMPNGIFAANKGSDIINFLLDSMDIQKGAWFGPSWLGDKVKEYLGLQREIDHEIVKDKLAKLNIEYILFPYIENNHFRHHALYSWSPENKRNFKNGNINYLWTK